MEQQEPDLSQTIEPEIKDKSSEPENHANPAVLNHQNKASFLHKALKILLMILTILAGVALVAAATVLIGRYVFSPDQKTTTESAPTPTVERTNQLPELPTLELPGSKIGNGLARVIQLETNLPSHPRFEVMQYEVVAGDSVFAIAEKYNLNPETIMWGNFEVLYDNPTLQPGMILNILPVNGVYYQWHNGDGIRKVAEFFGVQPEDILNFPGNHFDEQTLGNLEFPNIPAGSMVIVPEGKRTYVSWMVPRITRDNPAIARIIGPGACGAVFGGPVAGDPPYGWPAQWFDLSGYDWSPATNHFGIDVAGRLGHPIYSVAEGVVVYAGWNYGGYGIVVVVDHGNGFQTIYAHLDSMNVQCGSWVYTGTLLGLMGSTGRSTGPHLHFEIQNDDLGRVNPWLYLSH